LLRGKQAVTFAAEAGHREQRRMPMRAGGWKVRARSLAVSLGSLAALLVAGAANWPHH
jgi:hypothetical protein